MERKRLVARKRFLLAALPGLLGLALGISRDLPGGESIVLEYLDRILTRLTLPGAIFLAAITALPWFLFRFLDVQFYFGGTSILIVVGVALDTMRQMEAQLLMRHYEGFLK